ncbi:MAG: xanthine dehydrogenase family protein subunit M [Armatimonadetes bacterium]|nr:xanthine dehydrogenase family protein subunit M [Armatimonadota bacterium]
MRAAVPEFDLVVVSTLDEALQLLADGWRPFAGGTDVMVGFNAGKLTWKKFFSIWHLDELRGISVSDEEISLGALTTYTDVLANETLVREFPNLARAARETGAVAIQNRGTLGGNVANASPAADSPPALLTYGASLELISPSGKRRVPYDGFHTGYKQMQMQPGELVARIILPRVSYGRVHYYRKVGTRLAQAISKVVMSAVGLHDGNRFTEVAIAMGSVAPIPLRCHKTEEVLIHGGDASEALRADISPIDDVRSTRDYRMRVSENLLKEFIRKARGT